MPHSLSLALPTGLIARLDAVMAGHALPDAVATGFPTLDRILGGGVRRGDLLVLGGDVASGKSALALAMALRAARQGMASLVLSSEMRAERLMERLLAIDARAPLDRLRTGAVDDEARARLGAAALRLESQAPALAPAVCDSVDSVLAQLRARPEAQLVVVDGLHGLAAGVRPRDEELAAAVRALKLAAIDRDVALVLTAHLPRLDRQRRDPRPLLEDFGALGAVEQAADVVLGLFREEMYQPGRGIEGATELIVRKNRHGATGYVDLYFFADCMRFEDMVD